MLIEEVYRLADLTGDEIFDDLNRWSNKELLEYYGSLRIEEYYQWAVDNGVNNG